jgi:hypothetical protein
MLLAVSATGQEAATSRAGDEARRGGELELRGGAGSSSSASSPALSPWVLGAEKGEHRADTVIVGLGLVEPQLGEDAGDMRFHGTRAEPQSTAGIRLWYGAANQKVPPELGQWECLKLL